jgi:hypothetical protein
MKICRRLSICLGAILILSSTALAQVEAGLNELSLYGDFFHVNRKAARRGSDSESTHELNLIFGRFLTDKLALEVRGSFQKISGGNLAFALNAGPNLHFPFSRYSSMIPFLSAQIGLGINDMAEEKNSFSLGIAGGLKVFVVGGEGAVVFRPYYQYSQVDTKESGESFTLKENRLGMNTGVSIFFF